MSLHEVPCNLCGGQEYRIKYVSQEPDLPQQKRHFEASTDHYGYFGQIVTCKTCGLVFTNPRATDEDLLAEYGSCEDEEYKEEGPARSINAYFSLNTIGRFIKKGRLLDLGCSTGYFLNAARLQFDSVGVEPSVSASGYARDTLKLNVTTGTLETLNPAPESFSIVTLLDVIEHVPHPQELLRSVHGIIEPNGYIYLVTPNIKGFVARLLRSKWWGLRPAHIFYFSPETLGKMLENAGFEVVFTRSFGRAFTAQYWVSRLKN